MKLTYKQKSLFHMFFFSHRIFETISLLRGGEKSFFFILANHLHNYAIIALWLVFTETYICEGAYRCHRSIICLSQHHVCDGIKHCPEGDDELFCGLTLITLLQLIFLDILIYRSNDL